MSAPPLLSTDTTDHGVEGTEASPLLSRVQRLQTSSGYAVGGSIAVDEEQPLQILVKCTSPDPSTAIHSADASADSIIPTPLVQPTKSWQLPPPTKQSAVDRERLMEAILGQCDAASFGQDTERVLDTSYCSTYHLPPSHFVTSFHPAQSSSSILADIARMLSPQSSLLRHYMQAELYSLNVYTAGGQFKAHVDTPRADNTFGSVVVCLPVPHEGGQLTVRHAGQSRVRLVVQRLRKRQSKEAPSAFATYGNAPGGMRTLYFDVEMFVHVPPC